MRFHARRVGLTFLVLTTLYIFFTTLLHDQQALENSDLQQKDNFILQKHKVPIGLSLWQQAEEGLDLWPNALYPHDDRIVKQMRFVPSSYRHNDNSLLINPPKQKMKTIFVPAGLGDTPPGRVKFMVEQCPVDRCVLTDDYSHRVTADAVLYQNEYISHAQKNPKQIWILTLLESPFNTGELNVLNNYINWTATYRSDSTIVTPYEKFVHFDNFTSLPAKPPHNYAKGKTKLVAWFVSNCVSNNKRFDYAQELQEYIPVDIYGACGPHKCSRTKKEECLNMLKTDYKFYLSFENSNCAHYITEKFFCNALAVDVVPVVMGARRADYTAVSPPHSFIHVDDFESPKHLAEYLHKLDNDHQLYNEYFRWKNTGYFINTKFVCRVCAMLHGGDVTVASWWYEDMEHWWRNNNTCVEDRWDDPGGRITDWENHVY